VKAKIIVDSNCNLCGLCIRLCPTYVYELTDDNKIRVYEERCICCKACEALCPQRAIHVNILDQELHIEIYKTLQ